MTAGTIPVLFDTDIGSDIDDALALAYLLRQPRCELVGVTTVTGDVARRSALARAVCESAGRPDVEVHDGASDVLLLGPGQPAVPQYDAVADRALLREVQRDAVDFLRTTIRSRPGEITLLSVGPLTNVALLFALDPEIPSLLRSFVSMAGCFDASGRGEWNVRVDAGAAAVAYRAAPAGHVSVGLDVTTRCSMDAEEVRARFTAPPLDLVLEMAEVWFRSQERIVFHDPLAAVLPFAPELCRLDDGEVTIELSADGPCGATSFAASDGGRHRVAVDVDVDAFFAEFFGVFDT